MAVTRTTILAQGTTAAPSSVVTIDADKVASIGLFVASGRLPVGKCTIKVKTPGADCAYEEDDDGVPFGLSRTRPACHFQGPVELVIERPAGMDVGVYKAT